MLVEHIRTILESHSSFVSPILSLKSFHLFRDFSIPSLRRKKNSLYFDNYGRFSSVGGDYDESFNWEVKETNIA